VWSGYGKDAMVAATHKSRMVLTTRGKLEVVWALRGWQMATYLSTVNAVMVNTEAVDVSSVKKVRSRQYGSPNRHGYASHTVYSSGGSPEINHSRIVNYINKKTWATNIFFALAQLSNCYLKYCMLQSLCSYNSI